VGGSQYGWIIVDQQYMAADAARRIRCRFMLDRFGDFRFAKRQKY